MYKTVESPGKGAGGEGITRDSWKHNERTRRRKKHRMDQPTRQRDYIKSTTKQEDPVIFLWSFVPLFKPNTPPGGSQRSRKRKERNDRSTKKETIGLEFSTKKQQQQQQQSSAWTIFLEKNHMELKDTRTTTIFCFCRVLPVRPVSITCLSLILVFRLIGDPHHDDNTNVY